MFGNIKVYLYGIVTFIITALGVWVKILSEQNKSLDKDLDAKEKELSQSRQHATEIQDARKLEQSQNEINDKGEIDKENSSNVIDEIMKQSEKNDIKVTL